MAKAFPATIFEDTLALERCPRCAIHKPTLATTHQIVTYSDREVESDRTYRGWATYYCSSCAGLVVVEAPVIKLGPSFMLDPGRTRAILPAAQAVPVELPDAAARYLSQAINSLSSPDAAVVMAAASVDAMLKHLGLKDGTLNSRIAAAKGRGLITESMSEWAHEVRLAANEQRHADDKAEVNELADAERLVAFALALAEFLFALPARVTRGREIGGRSIPVKAVEPQL